ncbi:MAG: Mut7-C RNAse domain-containing protein [Methylococcales bacterium]|nr:Mut7-C RNAse domain-containing protein [Methylococcales bacterium]
MKQEYVAEFRFYEELNDFLPPEQRKRTINYRFSGHPGIKDPIEVFGVPHTEVELIIVDDQSVGFDYQLQDGDRVAVYPVFESLDISPLLRLRENPLRNPRFIMDVNLGKLAKFMRLLGFDSLYRNDYRDAEVVNIAVNEQRIVLTRDRRLLYIKHISHGYWVRAVNVESQIDEVLRRFDLYGSIQPFVRCLVCNGVLSSVAKGDILDRLEPKTRLYYEVFHQCNDCLRIYWEGSHMENMRQRYAGFLAARNEKRDFYSKG